jgi:hypothetical protein
VSQLQASAAGPFDMLLVLNLGGCTEDLNIEFGITTYALSDNRIGHSSKVISLCGCGLLQVASLTIAYLTDTGNPSDAQYHSLLQSASSPTFNGCDLLLTSGWPHDVHQFLAQSDFEAYQALGLDRGKTSRQAADLAKALCPRYHLVPGTSFYARPPYMSVVSGSKETVTRFVSLAPVSGSKDKDKKWMHALSLQPLSTMSETDISAANAVVGGVVLTANPYGDADHRRQHLSLSEGPVAKKSRFDSSIAAAPGRASMFFDTPTPPPPATSTAISSGQGGVTVFVGGVHPKATENEIRDIFAHIGTVSVFKADGKPFAFVTFESHTGAQSAITNAGSLTYRGRPLTINWAKDRPQQQSRRDEPPPKDHKVS